MREILNIPMGENDASAKTIGEYLERLLIHLWLEGEGFSAKRPFGNGGWQYEIYAALIKANKIDGKLDEDGFVEDVDYSKADDMICVAINELFGGSNG